MRNFIIIIALFMLSITPAYASQIEEDLAYLLSDSPTMDYNNSKLNKILSSYDLSIFKYYKAFIDYDKSKKLESDLNKAKKIFLEAEHTEVLEYWAFKYPSKESINSDPMGSFLSLLASKELYCKMLLAVSELKNSPDYIDTNPDAKLDQIPLWLVLKHPDILKYNAERFAPKVNAAYSVNNIPEFKVIESILYSMMAKEGSAPHGSIIRDIAANNRNFVEKMSFAPGLIVVNGQNKSVAKNLEGPWNRLLYKRFEAEWSVAVKALENYYTTHYGLKSYANQSELILSKYAAQILPGKTRSEKCEIRN